MAGYLLLAIFIVGLGLYGLRAEFVFPTQILFGIIPLLLIFSYLEGILSVILNDSWLVKIVGGGVAWSMMYITLLTLNIFKAATVRTVPLLKAARTTLLVIIFLVSIIWSVTSIRLEVPLIVIAILWGVFTFLVSTAYLYLGQVEVVEEFRSVHKIPVIETLVVLVIQLMVVFLTYAWPINLTVRTAYWSTSLLVLLVAIHGKKSKTLTQRGIRELIVMTWVLFLMIFLSGIQ